MIELIGAHNSTRNMGWFFLNDMDEPELSSWAAANPHMIFFFVYVTTDVG